MAGGLLNLVSYGAENVILNGNPDKTFFKAVYKKYTNFGLQRFRLLYEGQRTLSFDSETEFVFKIPRYAEMLWDTYLVLNLPDIWSPLHWRTDISGSFVPYEFQWIRNLGTTIIRRVTIYSGGGAILADYDGEWMTNAIQRDEGLGKKDLFNRMTGNIPELYDPASMYKCKTPWWLPSFSNYPNAIYDASCQNIEPSIRGRQLYIPLLAWFCYSPKTALPLIAMQYQEISIKFEFRPVREWFTIYDVNQQEDTNVCPPIPRLTSDLNPPPRRIAPPVQHGLYQMWHFLQPPPDISANATNYINRRQDWDADIHLIGTYIFLNNDERRQMAAQNHNYLIKTQHIHDFLNATGSRRVDLNSRNLVSSYMFRFRRSDVNLRNEWTNYTNWPFHSPPQLPVVWSSAAVQNKLNLTWSGCRKMENIKHILLNMGVLCGGEYRENMHNAGVYDYIEKWNRTSGLAKDGLYVYNFCIDSNRTVYQPSGAQNTNMWKYVTFEYNTIQPPAIPEDCANRPDSEVMCDSTSGNIIGIRKDHSQLNQYNYDLRVFEERYNMIVITSGRIGLLDAR